MNHPLLCVYICIYNYLPSAPLQVVAMMRLERRGQKSYGIDAVSAECQKFLVNRTPHRYRDHVMRSVFTHLLHSGVTEVVSTTGGRSVGRGAVQVSEYVCLCVCVCVCVCVRERERERERESCFVVAVGGSVIFQSLNA